MWAEESLYFETFFSNPNILDGFDALIYPAYYVLISRIVGFLASLVDPENAAMSNFHLWANCSVNSPYDHILWQ